jgi:hypothetical protein
MYLISHIKMKTQTFSGSATPVRPYEASHHRATDPLGAAMEAIPVWLRIVPRMVWSITVVNWDPKLMTTSFS